MQSYKKISNEILNYDLKSFIKENIERDFTKVSLQISSKYPLDFALLSEQIKLYKKARIKFPSFTNAFCFFTTKSFEQASSEQLAKYKSTLFKGNNLLDLSGGLGMDDWAFSNSFLNIISIDKDEYLNQIVRKNFEKLNVKNVERIDADALEFIKSDVHFDMIYLDADRRPESKNKRVAGLSNSEPNILQIKNRLFELTNIILLKLSPMLDITLLIDELIDVSDVYVVSLNNEVKELLVILKKNFTAPIIYAININHETIQQYSAKNTHTIKVNFSDTGSFFYEPSLSLIKSGISKVYANENGLKMLADNSYFFLSDTLIKDFFGRSFEVISKIDFSKSNVKKYLSQNSIVKANISKRNFNITVEELKKIFTINDGGEEYLFFTQNDLKQKLMFHCRKII